MDKNYRLRAPWAGFSDILGGTRFEDSLSEPVTLQEAQRLVAAAGCTIIEDEPPTIAVEPTDEPVEAPKPRGRKPRA